MGAIEKIAVFRNISKEELKKRFKQMQEDDLFTFGHDSYSGGWNLIDLVILSNEFTSEDEARKFLVEKKPQHEAYAVQFQYQEMTKEESKKATDLSKKLYSETQTICNKLIDTWKDTVTKFKESKPFVTCPYCSSKVNIQYVTFNRLDLYAKETKETQLVAIVCPLCRGEMGSKTIINKFVALSEKIINLNKIRNEKIDLCVAKFKKSKKIQRGWYVYGYARH